MPTMVSKDGSKHETDERINTITHLFGAILSLVGGALLIVRYLDSGIIGIAAVSVYCLGLFLLFLFSTLHHGINGGPKTNAVLRTFDYLTVYILIAGTFTPISLLYLKGLFGWTIFGVVWLLAIIGISLRASIQLPKWFTNTFYITMGWIGGIVAIPLIQVLPLYKVGLLALGGIIYTIGFVIYTIERPNPIKGVFGFHEIWHICVLLAAACHYFMFYL